MPLRFDPGVAEQILTYARLLTARGYVHNRLGAGCGAGRRLDPGRERDHEGKPRGGKPRPDALRGLPPPQHAGGRGAAGRAGRDARACRGHRGRVPGPRRRRFHVPKFAGPAVRLPRSPGAADVTRTRVGGHVRAPHVRQLETFTTRTAPECPDFGPFRAISARLSRVERCDLCSRLRYAFVLMRPATRTWIAVVIVGCVLAGGAYALTRPRQGQGGKTSGGASAAPGPRATPPVIGP